jgi:hypothetical protein
VNSQEEYRRFGIHALHQLAVVPTSSFRRAVPAVPGCLSIRRPDRSAGVLRGNGSSPSAGRTDEESGGHVKGLGVFLSVRLAAYNKSREVTRQLSTRVSSLSTGPSAGIAGREGVVATFGAPHAAGHRAAGRGSPPWPSARLVRSDPGSGPPTNRRAAKGVTDGAIGFLSSTMTEDWPPMLDLARRTSVREYGDGVN